jgi:glutathione-dependent peroxiredoxin
VPIAGIGFSIRPVATMPDPILRNREGQKVPDVSLRIRRNGEWKAVTTGELFAGKNVIVFSLPGAFTPTCSSTHLPRYN